MKIKVYNALMKRIRAPVLRKGHCNMKDEENKLLWYFREMSKEGKQTLLQIAWAFVATGSFSPTIEDMPADLQALYANMKIDVERRMKQEF